MAKKNVAKKKTAKKAAPAKKAAAKKVTAKKVAVAKSTTKKAIAKPKAKAEKKGSSLLGTTIGDFTVLNSQGKEYSQDNLKGHKTVLYFYPKDDTPGCTLEGRQFSDLKSEFEKQNTVILGVSKDSAKSHDSFICKFGFKIDLLADEKEKLCKIFDVIQEKNMYGRKYMGIVRSTFVIDENLKVIKEMRKVSPDGHAQEVLDFVKSL